jgi:putative effector of murein hydrolase
MSNLTFLPLVITIAAYQVGLLVSKKVKFPLCNPLLIAIVLVIGTLLLTGYSNTSYQAGMKTISWLLTPATICLAVPLYEQLPLLKKHWQAVASGS